MTFCAPDRDPRLYYIMQGASPSAGARTIHIDDSPRRGESGIMEEMRLYPAKRFGTLKLPETTFIHVGLEISQPPYCPVTFGGQAFTDEAQLFPASSDLSNQRQRNSDPEKVLSYQCKLGELCRLAAAFRPDICSRLAVFFFPKCLIGRGIILSQSRGETTARTRRSEIG